MMVKVAKRTILYLSLNPKNLDVERLSLNMNFNTLSTITTRFVIAKSIFIFQNFAAQFRNWTFVSKLVCNFTVSNLHSAICEIALICKFHGTYIKACRTLKPSGLVSNFYST